jgi:GTP-binding protein
MFDKAEIRVKAGDGGNGSINFRREKYIPYGGPDGGNGGRGGNVVLKADENVDSLRRYRQKRTHRAENGGQGLGQNKHGKDAEDLIIPVPPGTIITADEDGTLVLIADLEKIGDETIVAKGGRGGQGNTRYKTSTNQSPRIAQSGEAGEEKEIHLEMRLIADAGIIGYPNAGKSTLLSAASAARPKIASYPFTTLEPVLGVVEVGTDSFVLAEIPGLIEGAHQGRGLGHDFLRHAMRTKIFIHLVTGTSESPVKDLMTLNNELALFDQSLAQKPQIVVLNKIDLPEVQERRKLIEDEFTGAGIKTHYISAATGRGVPALMKEAFKVLKTLVEKETGEKPVKIFRPRPRAPGVTVTRQGEEFVISAPALERIRGGVGVTPNELRWQLNYLLKKMGVNRMLEKLGAQPGDKIRCGSMTWEW